MRLFSSRLDLFRISLLGGLLAAMLGQHAQASAPIEQQMSPTEFKAAGLDKLSAAELAALNAWLSRSQSAPPAVAAQPSRPAPAVRPEDVAVPEGYALVRSGPGLDENDRTPVESHIAGTFTGWSGNTRFRLANGQVWEQVDRSSVRVKPREQVAVRIAPRVMGTWRMKAEGVGQWVQVKRVE